MSAAARTCDRVQWAGWAGVLGALCWIAGDVLIVGQVVARAQVPLLFQHYAAQIDVEMAERLVAVPHWRLLAGALLPVFALPLYLLGNWHLWRGLRPAGRGWALPATLLLFLGYAWSPLAHAAFYFVGAVYQALPATDAAAHPPLLALAAAFRRALLIVYVPSVACSALGLLAFSAAVASGRSAYPRWFALSGNPLLLGALAIGGPQWLHGPLADALSGAGFNTLQLLLYLQSVWLLRRRRARGRAGVAPARRMPAR
ncbi:DUF6796 family protein [Xanthomonas sacchari]|uniref:DUF6796 family protein n=1 Tax=Xanthomonas sacchari TaxID=56458 RepID=UPI0020C32B27|nr:DUF6796 family protein [Xanthomonas sacchari]